MEKRVHELPDAVQFYYLERLAMQGPEKSKPEAFRSAIDSSVDSGSISENLGLELIKSFKQGRIILYA